MPFTIQASVNTTLPGSVLVAVSGDPNTTSTIVRVDGSLPEQPVRNWTTTGNGLESVVDAEAPLGRPVFYRLIENTGQVLAASNEVECPAPSDGRSLLRSVLKPTVAWMWVEPADETGVTWRTSTKPYDVIGSDTPVVVGEVRQRHAGELSFLCKTVAEASALVSILRDGLPMLVRHSPCGSVQGRDVLFYALDVTESRIASNGWRTVEVRYQSTKFVVGDTEEPPASWTFDALRDAHADFAALSQAYANFIDIALNRPSNALDRRDQGLFI